MICNICRRDATGLARPFAAILVTQWPTGTSAAKAEITLELGCICTSCEAALREAAEVSETALGDRILKTLFAVVAAVKHGRPI